MAVVVAIMLVLVALGSVVLHIVSPWWFTPIASNWGFIDTTLIITFWITGAVFIAVLLFTAYCVYRYRYQANRRAEYEPENKKLEIWLTVLTTVGVVVMLAPGLIAWNDFVTVPEGTPEVEVFGEQWQWTYRFPGKDGALGTSDIRNISDNNPFGLNLKDGKGRDDILIEDSELHLPLDKPVKILLRSKDVLHNFYVPQFRSKMDMVPGQITFFWLIPTRTGTFDILCFELCGVGHHAMRGKVVVEKESDFRAWLQKQPTFAKSLADAGAGAKDDLARVSGETGAGSAVRKITR